MAEAGAKIVIVTGGSLGDMHPFAALAHALRTEGLRPVIATMEYYRDYLASEGLDFTPIRPDLDDMLTRLGEDLNGVARRMEADDRYLFHDMIFPALRESYADLYKACEGAVAVVVHGIGFAGRAAAEKRRLPFVNIVMSPLFLPSIYDPPVGMLTPYIPAPKTALARLRNRILRKATEFAWPFWAAPWEKFRRELGLPKRRGGDFFSISPGAAATIALYSPLLAPRQADHPDNMRIAGFTFHDRHRNEGDEVLPALEAFLAAGDAPIIVTLGSFFARNRVAQYAAYADAARRLGKRAVLLVNADDLAKAKALAAEDVFVASYVPHSRVFPRASIIVHHGGSGTTGQALRAGKPQLVTPLMGDQPDNGARLARLGVARVAKAGASAERLAQELQELLTNQLYAQRALEAARIVAAEDGAAVAARMIAEIAHKETRHESLAVLGDAI